MAKSQKLGSLSGRSSAALEERERKRKKQNAAARARFEERRRPLTELDARIQEHTEAARDARGRVVEARERLRTSQIDLDNLRGNHVLGEASEKAVTAAEKRVDRIRRELEDANRDRISHDRAVNALKERRPSVLKSIKR